MIGYILGYTVIVNIVSFITMYIDKKRAKEGKWRVKEKLLFTLAFLLGEFGIILGMKFFRHKRRKRSFTYRIMTILVLHISVMLAIFIERS